MRDVDSFTVRVPITIKRRRGRKRVLAPDGTELASAFRSEPEIDNAFVKAIARAHRWQRMLGSGEYTTLRELATAERLDPGYVSRMLRLTLLAPALVEGALNGSQTTALDLRQTAKCFPADWQEQARLFICPRRMN